MPPLACGGPARPVRRARGELRGMRAAGQPRRAPHRAHREALSAGGRYQRWRTDATVSSAIKHLINPVESREADLAEKQTLRQRYDTRRPMWKSLTGFTAMDGAQTAAFVREPTAWRWTKTTWRSAGRILKKEGRDPSLTEIRMLDTYWSDHCRHTTFLTALNGAEIQKPAVEAAFTALSGACAGS